MHLHPGIRVETFGSLLCLAAPFVILACGGDGTTAAPPLFSDSFPGTSIEATKWTIDMSTAEFSIASTSGNPAPSLHVACDGVGASPTIYNIPPIAATGGFSFSFDARLISGIGYVKIGVYRRSDAWYYAEARLAGDGATQFLIGLYGGSPAVQNATFTPDGQFHGYKVTVDPSGSVTWYRDGIWQSNANAPGLAADDFQVKIRAALTEVTTTVDVDNVLVTRP